MDVDVAVDDAVDDAVDVEDCWPRTGQIVSMSMSINMNVIENEQLRVVEMPQDN